MKKDEKQRIESQPSTEWQELNTRFKSLCNEQEKLYRKDFEKVFKELYKIDVVQKEIYKTNGWNMGCSLPDEADTIKIKQALKKAGYSNDEVFCNDFLRYANVTIEGKKNMQQMAILNVNKEMAQHQQGGNLDEWQFYPIHITAPPDFIPIINKVIDGDAKSGKGLFSNKTIIEKEDEELDELLMIDAFGLKCSLLSFHNELKKFDVIGGFLDKEFTKHLFTILNIEANFIKDNTDKPAKVKNHITATITKLDTSPVWGLFFQILTLQGLCRWLEGININDGDNGYYEAQSLYDWLCKQLISKEMRFCFIPYSDNDKEILKPFCNYLYSTEIGKMVQNAVFKKDKNTEKDKTQQPPHFNGDYTDEELTATFNKLIQGKYIHSESDLDSFIYLCTGREGKTFTMPVNWQKTVTLLGLFVQDLFSETDNAEIWELTAKCFTAKGKTPNTNSIKVSLSKIKQNWKDRPKEYDKMQNEIIKDLK